MSNKFLVSSVDVCVDEVLLKMAVKYMTDCLLHYLQPGGIVPPLRMPIEVEVCSVVGSATSYCRYVIVAPPRSIFSLSTIDPIDRDCIGNFYQQWLRVEYLVCDGLASSVLPQFPIPPLLLSTPVNRPYPCIPSLHRLHVKVFGFVVYIRTDNINVGISIYLRSKLLFRTQKKFDEG